MSLEHNGQTIVVSALEESWEESWSLYFIRSPVESDPPCSALFAWTGRSQSEHQGALVSLGASCCLVYSTGWCLERQGRESMWPGQPVPCCQHSWWELMAETSQKAIFLAPAVPLLHPAPCPSSGEGSRWAGPRWHTFTCREERAAPVARPRCKCCCWQAGSSVAWQQASERRLLCPCS